MKRIRQWQKAYGRVAGSHFADLPSKLSSIRLGRLLHCKQACTYCFPHGYEASNSTIGNCERSWKRFRRTQWKPA